MKKILSLLLLTITTSLYPYVIQTVVLKNKTTNQRVVLYGNHHANCGNVTWSSESENLQVAKIKDNLTKLIVSQSANDHLLLVEDFTLTSEVEAALRTTVDPMLDCKLNDWASLLKHLKETAALLRIACFNVDYQHVYGREAAYLMFFDAMRQTAILQHKTDEELIELIKEIPVLNAIFEQTVKGLGIENIDPVFVRNQLSSAMAAVNHELKTDYQENERIPENLFNILSEIDARVELVKQRTLSMLSFTSDALSYDYTDLKTAFEILTTDKNVIGFLSAMHVYRVIQLLKDLYDIEYQSPIDTNQGAYKTVPEVLSIVTQGSIVDIKGVSEEDFDYIN